MHTTVWGPQARDDLALLGAAALLYAHAHVHVNVEIKIVC